MSVKSFIGLARVQATGLFPSYLDVNDVAELVGLQVGGQVLDALLLVGAREHVAGAASVALRVGHLDSSPEK
jgi:hypothetical protein